MFLATFKSKIKESLTKRFLSVDNTIFNKSLSVLASFLQSRHKLLRLVHEREEKEAIDWSISVNFSTSISIYFSKTLQTIG